MDLLSANVTLYPKDGTSPWTYALGFDGQSAYFDNQQTDASAITGCPG
jgi:hypothetical protein